MRIEFEQSRRLRSGVAELEAQLDGGQLGRRPREEHITVAHCMQGAGATEGAADFKTRDRLADMMDYDERRPRGVVEAPGGAHFTSCEPDYGRDEVFQREYVGAAADPQAWAAFEQRYLDVDEDEYQREVRARGG